MLGKNPASGLCLLVADVGQRRPVVHDDAYIRNFDFAILYPELVEGIATCSTCDSVYLGDDAFLPLLPALRLPKS